MFKATTLAVLMLAVAGSAFAQNPRNAVVETQRAGATKPSKTVSKVRQPVGTPHKASAFAPRHTNKRVFGDPIQAPIVHGAIQAPVIHSAPPPK
jgi:hypothetical protein